VTFSVGYFTNAGERLRGHRCVGSQWHLGRCSDARCVSAGLTSWIATGVSVGSVHEGHLFDQIVVSPELLKGPVETIMQPALPFADISTGVDALAGMLTAQSPAVLVRDFKSDETYIITRWDVIKALS
jgi:hypothetical protein